MLQKKRVDKINGKINFILIRLTVFLFNKYISRILITSLIIISFYNFFSILILSNSFKIEGYFNKTLNYLPYKHSIFFQKPLRFSRKDIRANNPSSKRFYYLLSSTEKRSALDYTFWETKILHQINNENIKPEFERNFINLVILSKNKIKKNESLRLYYLRNIPRFSSDVGDLFINN